MISKISFLDLQFNNAELDDVGSWLSRRNSDSLFDYVVTPNVDHMVRIAESPREIRRFYEDATLCLCDSRVLALLAAGNGIRLPVVPGSDLVAAMFDRVLRPGDKVCVVGGAGESMAVLRARFPRIEIIHQEAPFGLRTDAVARAVTVSKALAAGARFILLAVGSPQQEMIAWEISRRPDARGTALCIGASIDFLTGAQSRAPRVVQRLSMEWAWRLASQPRRLARRYLVDCPRIFPLVLRWRWRSYAGLPS